MSVGSNLRLPEMDPCAFCEFVVRNGSWDEIERTDLTLTLLNSRQYEIGQCIVLPHRHAPTLLDLTDAEGAAVMAAAKRLSQVLIQEYAPDGILLYQNNGVASGQEVPHFHLHVVPRTPSSDWGFGPPHIARLERKDLAAKLDYRAVTDQKMQTAEALRRHFL